MKRYWLLLFLLVSSCRGERSVDFISLLPFAESRPDTEVLLFAAPKTQNFLTSWSDPRRQLGGRFRWSTSERPSFSWTLGLPEPAFLHVRLVATESFPMEVHFDDASRSRYWIDRNSSVQIIPVPQRMTRAQLRLPGAGSLGIHSAVITPSRVVAEFRKPQQFPFIQKLHLNGKKRNAAVCETGGSITFYQPVSPESELEFGYYFVPSNTLNDSARFSVRMTGMDGKENVIFQQRVTEASYRTVRIPLRSIVAGAVALPHKLDFRIERDTAFGDGQTAWIDPRLYEAIPGKAKPHLTSGLLQRTMDGANVLFIILDAASVRRIGTYGYNLNTTPVIDKLALEGIQFQRAYTNAVYTLASSATILTGHLPLRHGILQHRNKLSSDALTLPEMLQASGYETAAFLANGNVSTSFGLTQGFRTLREVFRDKSYIGRGEDITSTFSDWLENHGNRKFFAYLHYREPHDPYQPPVEWVKKFADPGYSGPILRNFQERIPIEKNAAGLTREDRNYISALYDANLAYGDFQVGQVLELLKRRNIYDRTMIIVTSDHGEAFWEHGYQGHNVQLYEESARVPLIIKFPEQSGMAGKKIYDTVQHADFYATFVDLLGLSGRGVSTDGSSFVPRLSGIRQQTREIVVQSTKRSLNALVLDDYKYIRGDDQPDELYNLKKDPSEKNNLITAEKVRAGYLRQLLLRKLETPGKRPVKTESAELDDAARENLKALGYLD